MWMWLLIAVVFISGCTGYVTYNGSNTSGNINATFSDLCVNVICETSQVICPDGFVAECNNTCVDGQCTSCVPSCEGHVIQSCENVICPDITYTCPDGYIARCQQMCHEGRCLKCVPDCTGHYLEQQNQTQDLCANKDCGITSKTCPDYYVASCNNSCVDGSCVSCISSCAGHELSHVIFTEVMYDTQLSGERDEWLELYNPLDVNVNLTNWTISDNSGTWKFANASINKKSYLVIAKNAAAFQASFDCAPHVTGFTRTLNNDGDQLLLKDDKGSEIDFVAWEKGADDAYPDWSVAVKEGKSLARIGINDTDSVQDWQESEPKPNC